MGDVLNSIRRSVQQYTTNIRTLKPIIKTIHLIDRRVNYELLYDFGFSELANRFFPGRELNFSRNYKQSS